ncbi:MAG: TonB-dependent siderophore receptor [Candidatus Electronema aureum]|uniref:TonB-dependent siderophore receptor n=1 Tax=Candidatus Electronema aureum TaxID=2005002 RepID=A0A521G3P2_9BACT|nr:MAG: TonB-dependent siderophore receptor [Candidatus Electronema aureum]
MKSTAVSVAAMTAVLTIMNGPSAAQEQAHTMNEIVVTATKTEREVKEIPTNVAVLTEKDIEQIQPTDTMDLLRHVPGLVLNGMGSSKASHYAGVRGMQPSSRGMLLLMDGIEMNDPSNYLSVSTIPLDAIERIEVIKTPASVLYGPAAVGGVINIITKKPSKPLEARVAAGYGSFERKEVSANIAGLRESGLTYGLNYQMLDSDGYRDNSWRTQHAFTPRLGYLGEQVDFDLVANVVDAEYAFPGGLPLSTWEQDPTKSLQPDREGDSVKSTVGATMNWSLNESNILKLKTSYRDNDWETEDYGMFFKGDNYKVWTGEAAYQHLAVINGMRNSLLLGTEYRDLNNEPSMYMDDQHGSMLLSQAKIQEQITGFFVQDELSPTDKLLLNLGVRYDQIDTDFTNKLMSLASFDSSHDKWSPRFGLTYTVAPELAFFGNYSQGIRSVNLARSAFQLKSNIVPETEESIEVGLRGVLGGVMEYTVAGFQVNTEDKIIQKERYLYENAGEAESKGIEASLTRSLPCGFYASADYTYINAEFTEFSTSSTTPDAAISYNGKRVPLVPENIFGLTVGRKDPLYGHLSASLRYVDEKFIDNANTLSLGDYTVVDVKYTVGLQALFPTAQGWDFTLAVNNLFDETYAEYGEANGGSYVPEPVAFPADGVSVFGGISYSF